MKKSEHIKNITQHTDTATNSQLSYEIVNEFYDTSACKAYIKVRVPRNAIKNW